MITFKKSLLSIFLVTIFGSLHAQTLDQYLTIAAENNPGLKAKYAEFEIALQQVSSSASLPDPTLSFGYFISPVETRVGPQQMKIGLSQMFPWFGTIAAKGEMLTLNAEAKFQEFLDERNTLYFEVRSACYSLMEVDQELKLQANYLEILNSIKELALINFENGKANMVDVIRVDIMIEEQKTEILLLETKLRPLYSNLYQLLNTSDSTTISLPDSFLYGQMLFEYSKDSMLEKHPLIEALDLKIRSAQVQENVAKKMTKPNLGVGLDYVLVGEGATNVPDNGKDILMPMVSLSIPIYRKKNQAVIQEAKFKKSMSSSSKEDYQNKLISTYDQAWYELTSAIELIELYKKQINSTESALNLLIKSYSNSGNDFEEVLRMQQLEIKYKMAKIKALRDYSTAEAKLDYLTSKSGIR